MVVIPSPVVTEHKKNFGKPTCHGCAVPSFHNSDHAVYFPLTKVPLVRLEVPESPLSYATDLNSET